MDIVKYFNNQNIHLKLNFSTFKLNKYNKKFNVGTILNFENSCETQSDKI